MPDDRTLSVRDVLALEPMQGAEVLAGRQGLDRGVTGVNIVEVPDVSRWLRGGEILFTAGYAWRDDHDQLIDALHDFDRLDVSGLVVKLGTYLESIPAPARAVADDLALPIIRLPKSVAYMDVIDPLSDQLRARRLWMFERLHNTEQLMLAPGLDEQSVERVAGLLARQIGNPVHVLDLVDEMVVTATADGGAATQGMDDLDPDLAADLDLARSAVGNALGRAPVRHVHSGGRSRLCAPLVVSHELRGAVVAVEDTTRLDDFAQFGLAHTAQLISFLILKRLSRLEGRGEAMALLVRSLLEDRMTGEEAAERALALGLRLARPCAALVVGSAETRSPEQLETLRTDVSRRLGPIPHAVGPDGDLTAVLVQADDATASGTVDAATDRIMQTALQHKLRRPVIAVGSVRTGLDGLRRSWSEACIAYQTRALVDAGGVVRFEELGVERLLSQIPLNEVTVQYVHSTIGEIEDDAELLRTLQVYVESGGRKLETAKKLPLHRSSLEHRLEKIAKLLDVDPTIPERQLELWLALRLRQMHGLNQPSHSGRRTT